MKKLLPVGSVVLLSGGTKKTVIMGILQKREEKEERVYDYLGIPYPEGYLGKDSSYLFDHENITEVYFRGLDNEERQKFMKFVEENQ